MKTKVSIFWFRRDLRLEDNVGLLQALSGKYPVIPIFVFDQNILDRLEDKSDRRVDYIHQSLAIINAKLKLFNSSLKTFYGNPIDAFRALNQNYKIVNVFCNRDYEPYAIKRDAEIYQFLREKNIPFLSFKDQVIFEIDDILKSDGTPYTVYTPYSKKWKLKLELEDYVSNKPDYSNFFNLEFREIHSLNEIGFNKTNFLFELPKLEASVIGEYDMFRDYPAIDGTTRLGVALRFGTISIRECVAFAKAHNAVWLNELIWREFFIQILYHFPKVVDRSFKAKYDFIEWRNNEQEFNLWCQGKTGYPLVDAGMRQLNETGFMHNRARMIAASFLCKHLLIDWRWGEAYFAQKLNDYDLSANNGNWQWAAGSGCDAVPYFRIFNPLTQAEKFDKNLEYIKKWLPELESVEYPEPIVEHRFARERAMQIYRKAIDNI